MSELAYYAFKSIIEEMPKEDKKDIYKIAKEIEEIVDGNKEKGFLALSFIGLKKAAEEEKKGR